jgi:pimeloyl-ACP methyl ester carboxylesterase
MPLLDSRHKQMIANLSILLLFVLGLAYLGGMIYAATFADKMIFPEVPKSYADGPETFKLQARDGAAITATYLDAPNATRLLLYSHGNAADLGMIRADLKTFQAAGISVLAYDYPGYGTSSDKASEAGVYAAADAAYTYATTMLNFAPEQITLYGRSLGSGPSCWLAEHYPVDRIIIDGGFSSTFRVMTRIKVLPWDKFDNLARLRSIQCPVLIIHGTLDETVPFTHAKQNWAALTGDRQKLWVEGAGHNNLREIAGQAYWDTVLPFIHAQHSIEI